MNCRGQILQVVCAVASVAASAPAQSAITGKVLRAADSSAIAGATVRILGADSQVITRADGRYSVPLPDGAQRVIASALGTRPETLTVSAARGRSLQHDFMLTVAAEALPTVAVKATQPSRFLEQNGFYERQSAGIGSFITPEKIEREQGRLVGEIIAKYSRASVRFGGTHAWIATTRTSSDGGCAFCKKRIQDLLDQTDIEAGARPACYMDVYLNGQSVYRGYGQDSHTPPQLFDLNSIPAREIEAIEVFTSASQIPARFNASSSGCGVALIWTKR